MPIYQTGNESLLLGIELNNYCNLDCKHCLREIKEPPKNFSPPLLGKILREAKSLGSKIVGFTGGEPFLHPKLDEILHIVQEEGYNCYFVTNGSQFDKIFPLLVQYKSLLSGISFSLDGATKETHDFMRGEGSFKKSMAAIAACYGEKIPFNLQMCLNKKNRQEIPHMTTLAAQLGAQHLFYALSMPTHNLVSADLLLSPHECRKAEDEINNIKSRYKFDVFMAVGYFVKNPLFSCRALSMNALNIDFSGNLTFCCQLSNYRNAANNGKVPTANKKDIVGSLLDISLLDAINKLRQLIGHFYEKKILQVQSGLFKEVDHFPCMYCAKWFGKIDWLEDMPANPWN